MTTLAFPLYSMRIKNTENNTYIFDPLRKKFVVLQPEEWVRQHVIQFLIQDKGFPKSLIQVEKQIQLHQTTKRYDLVVFYPDGRIRLLVECKAPQIVITQKTFDQIARYNMELDADWLMVTNGLRHYYCKMNKEKKNYSFLRDIPDYKS
ncbi:MAG: type I restriction enzyme HsdR N-terminal domain-containing protein [Flavobacteriaceae bacterium]|nr:type I restriction enzyme HsdR N-terminal domain-containing protein [Flavobacteriaceae bacterium]